MSKKEATKEEKRWYRVLQGQKKTMAEERVKWAKYTKAYRSAFDFGDDMDDDETSDIGVQDNVLFAFVDSLVANISPPNPEADIIARRKKLKGAAKLRTALVNDTFMREHLAQKLWKMAGRGCIYPRMFSKVVWSAKKGRPAIRIINPHHIFFDGTAECWEDVRYVCEATTLTRGEFMARVKKRGTRKTKRFYREDCMTEGEEEIKFQGFPEWLRADADYQRGTSNQFDGGAAKDSLDAAREAFEWIVVYELYDLVGKRFYHFADGVERPLYVGDLPYKYLPNPYQLLAFNDDLESIGGMSDASLIYPTLCQLNEAKSLQLWHGKTSIPSPIVNSSLLDDPESFFSAYEEVSGPGQVIEMDARPNVGVHDVLGHTPVSNMPISWGAIMADLNASIEFTLGLPSYQRGDLGGSDVATAYALADTSTRSRNQRRQKALYLVIADMAEAIIALYSEFLAEDSTIPVRLTRDSDSTQELDRAMLALPNWEETGEMDEYGNPVSELPEDLDVLSFDYTARPFNADEGNSVVQLKRMEAFLPLLLQSQNVDQEKLIKYIGELLKTDILPDKAVMQAAAAQAVPGGVPDPNQPPPPPGMGAPPMAEPTPPGPGAMVGGQVDVGAGSGGMPAQEVGGPLV